MMSTSSSSMQRLVQSLRSLGTGTVTASFSPRRRGTLARISLSNPNHKNALSGKMMVELAEAITTIESKPEVSVVMVQGEGDFFCAGADLSVANEIDGATMCEFMQDTTTRLHNLPAVSVAVIRGGAVGGGTELATACDHRVFANDAIWRCVHATMGISPGWGGGGRLCRLIGRSRAIELLCSARKLQAWECEKFGLADYVAPIGHDVEEIALKRYERYFDMPSGALRACKKSVIATEIFGDQEQAMKRELQVFASVWGGKDNLEALERVRLAKAASAATRVSVTTKDEVK